MSISVKTIVFGACAALSMFAVSVTAQEAPSRSAVADGVGSLSQIEAAAGPTVDDYLACVAGCTELFPQGGKALEICVSGCSKTSSPKFAGNFQIMRNMLLRPGGMSVGGGGVVVGGGTNFVCDSETGDCTCTGTDDCFDMGGAGVCDPEELTICWGNKCSCTWKRN